MARCMRHKCIGYGIMVLVFFVLQTAAASPFKAFGCTPDFLLLLALAVTFRESETFSGFFALICGFLSDALSGTAIGLRAVFYMLLAYLLAVLLQTVLRPLFLTFVYISLGAVVLSLMLDYLFYILVHGAVPFGAAFKNIMLPQFLLDGVWAYIIYYIVYRFNLSLTRRGILQ